MREQHTELAWDEEEEEVPTTEEPETPEEVPGNAKTVVLAVFGGLIAVSAVLMKSKKAVGINLKIHARPAVRTKLTIR